MSFIVKFPVLSLVLLLLAGGCAATTQDPGSAGAPGVPASTLRNQPESLIGLDRTSLSSTLGEPRMLRHEAPAEIWQYRSQSCVLDVFLYEAPGGAEKVKHLESRNNLAEAVAMDRCMKSVLRKT